jgi:hypothetical protein
MSSPFVEFEVQTVTKIERRMTNFSKRPNPSNPNFNERILIPIDIPRDTAFAPFLTVSAPG